MQRQEGLDSIRRNFREFFARAPRTVPEGTPNPFIIFEHPDEPDGYVQFKLFGDDLLGEVGSREWTDAPRPFSAAARGFLAAYGFSGGGPGRNYAREHLPLDPDYLAGLVAGVFSVYGDEEDVEPVVRVWYGPGDDSDGS